MKSLVEAHTDNTVRACIKTVQFLATRGPGGLLELTTFLLPSLAPHEGSGQESPEAFSPDMLTRSGAL